MLQLQRQRSQDPQRLRLKYVLSCEHHCELYADSLLLQHAPSAKKIKGPSAPPNEDQEVRRWDSVFLQPSNVWQMTEEQPETEEKVRALPSLITSCTQSTLSKVEVVPKAVLDKEEELDKSGSEVRLLLDVGRRRG